MLIGPVLMRPYTQLVGTSGQKQELTATIFPKELDVRGVMLPSERRRGLYKVPIYEFQGDLKGRLEIVDPPLVGTVTWGEPYLALSVADTRGIVGTPKVSVNGLAETMLQGAPPTVGWQPNLHIPLRGATALKGSIDFVVHIDLAGTETLGVAPVGDSNHLEIHSIWGSPLFSGQFLPRTRDIENGGFRAAWDVSSLASGTQAQLQATPVQTIDRMNVSLTTLVDPYTLSNRAVKYGILFVVLTFGGFLIFELMKQLPIHPVQYLLVGFGLAIFFLLLVSFSEHMVFGFAYLIASIACIGLLTFYLSFVLQSARRGFGFGTMLVFLYSAIYGLLVSEDNALVLGSLMLFSLLAGVMFITRKVDWYQSVAGLAQMKKNETFENPSAPSV